MTTCTNVTSGVTLAGGTISKARRSSLDGLLREVHFMGKMRRHFVLLSALAVLCALAAQGQDSQSEDSPSLGDAARQARLQKQQKDAQAKSAPASGVQSNEEQSKEFQSKHLQNKDGQSKDSHSKDPQSKTAASGDTSAKDAQPAKAKHVITNDEIPEHVGPTRTFTPGYRASNMSHPEPPSANNEAQAESWKARIQQMKASIAALQSEIEKISDSIQYTGANCVSGCVQWNERQQQKQQQVEALKAQVEQQQKSLEDMQEMARRQGYGSSVYDP